MPIAFDVEAMAALRSQFVSRQPRTKAFSAPPMCSDPNGKPHASTLTFAFGLFVRNWLCLNYQFEKRGRKKEKSIKFGFSYQSSVDGWRWWIWASSILCNSTYGCRAVSPMKHDFTFHLTIQSTGWDCSLLRTIAELPLGTSSCDRRNAAVVGDVLDWVCSKKNFIRSKIDLLSKFSPSVSPNRSTLTVQHSRRRRSEGKCNLTSFVFLLRFETLITLEVFTQNIFASLLFRLPDGLLSLLDLRTLLSVAGLQIVDASSTFFFFLLAMLLGRQRLSLQFF